MSDIDGVVFDLGEVYLMGMIGIDDKIAEATGVDKTLIWDQLHGDKLENLFRGNISEREYWQKFINETGYNLSVEFLEQAIRQNFRRIDGVEEVIRELRSHGYRLGLISDHCMEWIAYCEKYFPINELFETRCYSFEEGLRKTGTEIYHRFFEMFGIEPNRVIGIDDRQKRIEVMKQAGIEKTILFQNALQLRGDLIQYGIILYRSF
jgi:HAD superfamily hydrolase (TIGR01509 family)